MYEYRFNNPEDWEVEAIEKAQDRHGRRAIRLIRSAKKVKVSYSFSRDNFTVAHILDGKYLYTGVAKRNPRDNDSILIGENIALSRAVISYPVKI